jgi:predicted unusual protein kinase regulating ubiquinone biosynthesis (AarF/ABC1/UbiB family)
MDFPFIYAGLFIKLGQVLSSRPDFVPHQYTDRFSLLQDYVPPWPSEEIKDIIKKSLHDYQQVDFEQVFDAFDPVPLGSASIGQVHAATLTPEYYRTIQHKNNYTGGIHVAVKVMHRDAEDRFRHDFKIFKWLCRLALPGWKRLLNELERQMMTEFDYRREIRNLKTARKNMYDSPYKDKVVIPEPIEDCSSPYVLVMELLEGEKLADVAETRLADILDGDRDMAKSIIRQKRKGLPIFALIYIPFFT